MQAHNIRFTAFCDSPGEREQLEALLSEWLDKDVSKRFEREDLEHERFDTIYSTKLWLDKQPLVRAALDRLREDLSEEDAQRLVAEADLHLDERINFHFRIDKPAFFDGKIRHALRGDVIQVRINVAAFPKNEETVLAGIAEIFGR